jgi:hypothetical protein
MLQFYRYMPKLLQNTEQLRAQAEQLLSQARAQSIEIQRVLGAVLGDGALQSRLTAAAAQISGVIGKLSLALNSPDALHQIDLTGLEGLVHSAETRALITEASAQTKGSAALAEAVVTASAATRQETQTVTRDVFERRIFDAYLHFDSKEDEDAFRRREAEAQEYIATQLARHTPEGDLNAGGGVLGHLLDADAHGAGDSPEFMRQWNAMAEKTQSQRAAMHAAGQSTEEYDRNLALYARRFFHTRGWSDAQIDEQLARSGDPLAAVKPFLGSDRASRHLEVTATTMATTAHLTRADLPRTEAAVPESTSAPAPAIDHDAMAARLKAIGLSVSDNTEPDSGHGLPAQKFASKAGPSVAG